MKKLKYFTVEDVEVDNEEIDLQICDEDESNNIFLTKGEALELAKLIKKIMEDVQEKLDEQIENEVNDILYHGNTKCEHKNCTRIYGQNYDFECRDCGEKLKYVISTEELYQISIGNTGFKK